MKEFEYTTLFKKDLQRLEKRGKSRLKLFELASLLLGGKRMPESNRDHKLKGKYRGFKECHIEPDWLLIYKITETSVILYRTGSHADLFDKT